EPVDLAVVDVSFISLALVLAPIVATLRPGGRAPIVALVKPQFEVGRGGTNRGVVRDPAAHRAVLEQVVAAAQEIGLGTRDVIASPILGPKGIASSSSTCKVGRAAPRSRTASRR